LTTDGPRSAASAQAAQTVAAVDIGTNSLRMVIAEVTPDGRTEVLERLQRSVRLGQDTFRRGRLGAESMRAALAVLKDYRKLLDLYKVSRVKAVATSAVREASNADTFLDRIFLAVGFQVEVIDTSEETRLTVSAVREALGDAPMEQTLIADVGGGSTLLAVLQGGQIVATQSLRLGSIRIQEMLVTSDDPPQRSAEILRQHVANVIDMSQGALPLGAMRELIAVGGDARFVASRIGRPTGLAALLSIDLVEFDKFVDRSVRYTATELARRHGLPFAEAETLNAALLIYQALLHRTQAERMLVSHVSMRDGLLLELAREVTGGQDDSLVSGVILSAMTLAEKFHADAAHGTIVAELAVRLFDQLQADHGLGPRYRLLLRVAALLHEVGGFLSNRAHHKHSEYLIANSEIFGLTRSEVTLVSLVARYHRRSPPRPTHASFMALPREQRVIVSKLAAILRVADALSRGRVRTAKQVAIERREDELILQVPGGVDLTLERRSLAAKGDMFEEIFGLKLRLEEG
jgi:exopolyphosphatase/guanosine-5'-triphosphate,3'-diphosphate pyrophosphatase